MSDRKPVIISEEQLEEQRQYIQQIRLMPDAPKSYHVVTYGCQMNAHDSEILAGMLRDMGMKEAADRESADFVLFNTCCVRDNAERRALGNVTWLKEVRKKNPRLMIGVCGCMIQQPGMAEKILKQYRFVDLAFGTANLYRRPERWKATTRWWRWRSRTRLPRVCPCSACAMTRRISRLCTAATTTAPTASCRMCAGGSVRAK